MTEQQRIILALALSFGILFAWQTFFAPPPAVQDMQAVVLDEEVKPVTSLNMAVPAPSDGPPNNIPPQPLLPREIKRFSLENKVIRAELGDGLPSLRRVELR